MNFSKAALGPLSLAAILLAGCAFAGSAGAMSKAELRVAHEKAQGTYRSAWDACKPLQGNAKDICKVEAQGQFDIAKAELEARFKPTPKHDAKVRTEKAVAAYRLAREKCGDLRANAKEVCKKDAKAAYVAASGEAKLSRTDIDAGLNSRKAMRERKDVREDTADALFAAARERCDGLSGEAKQACVLDAKKKFGKQ